MKLFRSTDKKFLTLKLFDTRSDKFVLAKVFDSEMTFLGNYNLPHLVDGYYRLEVTLPVGNYFVIYEVFKDSGYTVKDGSYSHSEEFIRVENFEVLIESSKTYLANKLDDNDGRIGISC